MPSGAGFLPSTVGWIFVTVTSSQGVFSIQIPFMEYVSTFPPVHVAIFTFHVGK